LRDLTGHTEPQGWGRERAAGENPAAPDKAETALESAVSLYIGQMPFVVLAVDDEPGPRSARAFIERNSIALLSNYARPPIDPPSPAWLGRRCGRRGIRSQLHGNHEEPDARHALCGGDVGEGQEPEPTGLPPPLQLIRQQHRNEIAVD
jgi:hypothetical protein